MRVTKSTIHSHTLHLPSGGEVSLDFEPADTYGESILVHEEGNSLVVAYLAYDHDAENPLENSDGMGKVVGRGKYETRNHSERELFEALGLDREGEPDTEFVGDAVQAKWVEYLGGIQNNVWIEMLKRLGATPQDNDETQRFVNALHDELCETDVMYEGTMKYALSRAESYVGFIDSDEDQLRSASTLLEFDVEAITMAQWRKGRDEGTIGDRDAVMLDVYEHSGIAWSISGGGTQCRWDTSRGAGIWIPDDSARDEIDRRAPVYALVRVWEPAVTLRGAGHKYQVLERQFGAGQTVDAWNSVAFSDDWSEMFQLAEQRAAALLPPTEAELREGRRYAAFELASNAIEQHNRWLSGDCYGCVVETFIREDTESDWEQHEIDHCWSYVGSEYACETLKSEFFDPAVKALSKFATINEKE